MPCVAPAATDRSAPTAPRPANRSGRRRRWPRRRIASVPSMPFDRRTPVVVGVGQTSQRADPASARPPIELFEDAARVAADDAGHGVLDRVDTVAAVQIVSWPYADPGAFVARRLGIEPRATVVSTVGGNSPQLLLNEMGSRI